jgi:hypothetical protein
MMDEQKAAWEARQREMAERLEESLRWIRPADHELGRVLETVVPIHQSI